MALQQSETAGYHDTGAIYDLVQPTHNNLRPLGEWNHVELTCDRNMIMVVLNGSLGKVAGNPEAVVGAPIGGVPLMVAAGLLVGLGSGIGNGCTSGHGVCGIARLSPRSMLATLVFLLTGVVTVYVVRLMTGHSL